MNRVFQLRRISSRLVQESEAHRVMRVRDWKSHRVMKEPSSRWHKCFAENHGSDGCRPDKPMAIIQRLCSSTDRSSEETLVIPRCFAVALQPISEVGKHARNVVSELCIPRRSGFGSLFHCHFHLSLRRLLLADFRIKVVDLFELQQGRENVPQLFHLFAAMKPHQFTGDRPLHPSGRCPTVTGKKGCTVERLLCGTVGYTEELPQR